MTTVVYWLFDETCICPRLHGYVGISARLTTRLSRHRKAAKFPPFKCAVLFSGPRGQCLSMERRLRPHHWIGWNWAAGGFAGGEAPKTAEHRAKISAAARARYADPAEREKARQYQAGKHDRWGKKNHRYGTRVSEQTRSKMSVARKGKAVGNQNWKRRGPYSPEALLKMSKASKRRWAHHP